MSAQRKRLVIHAGLGKSGSSAIQRYCRDNPQALRAAGALYLGMYFERGQPTPPEFDSSAAIEAALARDPAVVDRLAAVIAARIAAFPGFTTFVWSQIGLATHGATIGRLITTLAPVCDVEVILYFRHQADWLVSSYLQWGVKHKTYPGEIRPFAAFRPYAGTKGASYRTMIEAWRAALPPDRLHLRSYDRTEDVVADFLAIARLGVVAPDTPTRHYETPDPALLTLFRLHQGQQDGTAPPGALMRALAANGMEGRRYREVDPASTLPTGDDWTKFAASFDAENAALERDFGLTLGPPGHGPARDPTLPAPAILIPALLDLILGMDRRIAALERQVREKKG